MPPSSYDELAISILGDQDASVILQWIGDLELGDQDASVILQWTGDLELGDQDASVIL